MNALRARLHDMKSDDNGLSLVEVVVAMVLFAMIVTGTLYSMLTILTTTRDSRNEQVAANLAAQDIDLARDYDDVFKLLPTTYDIPLNGDVFTVTRQTEWVNTTGNDVKCGSGGTALSYKRVNVSVTWGNMRAGAKAVRADTVVDPNSRITDPTKGTIFVRVNDESGVGNPGVTVTVSPSASANGATTPNPNSVITDASGCAYILKVTPGNYDVKVTQSSGTYVDDVDQLTAASKFTGVQANSTASVSFGYDDAGRFQALWASNYFSLGRPLIAADMKTTFYRENGTQWSLPRPAGDKFLLHPFGNGYNAVAGNIDDCAANDPQAWTLGSSGKIAPPSSIVSAKSGDTVFAPIDMGVVQIIKTSGSGGAKYLRAVSIDAPVDGNPGCATTTTLRWSGQVIPNGGSGSVTVALPYGNWYLYADNNAGDTGTSPSSRVGMNGSTSINVITGGSSASGAVTLDPRTVTP